MLLIASIYCKKIYVVIWFFLHFTCDGTSVIMLGPDMSSWLILIITNTIKSNNIDSEHGWITCGKFPRVGHMWTVGHGWSTCGRKGFPLRLINQSETALQNYMVYVWIHVENVSPKPHCTYYPHVPVCTHGFHVRLPCGHMIFHVLYMSYS